MYYCKFYCIIINFRALHKIFNVLQQTLLCCNQPYYNYEYKARLL